MVRDAEAAGFNPLTAIRNGGSAGFTSTSTPGLSSGEFIADALKGVGQIVSNYDPMSKATADLEYRIKQETLKNLQADTSARLKASIGGVPASVDSGLRRSSGGMVPATPKAPPDLYVPYRDNSEAGGGKTVWLPNPDIADIEQVPVAVGASGLKAANDEGGDGLGRHIPGYSSDAGTKLPGFGDRVFKIPPLVMPTLRTGTYKPVRPTKRNSAGRRLYPSSPILPPS